MATARRNKLALIWEGENGDFKSFSYFALRRDVCRFANVLRSLGLVKGDRVTIYMGRIPELPIAMLACATIGAVHSVVFGGFTVEALADRIEDSQSKVLITCDGAYQRGKVVPLKQIADEALHRAGTVESVLVVKRTGEDVNMEQGRDLWFHELMNLPIANGACKMEIVDAEDPLFMLYTSGTTGKPKAILHTHGGYMVGTYTTLKYVFDIREEDSYWCAADPGWVTGLRYATVSRSAPRTPGECHPCLCDPQGWRKGARWSGGRAAQACCPRDRTHCPAGKDRNCRLASQDT